MRRFLRKLFKICLWTTAGISCLFILAVIVALNSDKPKTASEVAPPAPEPPDPTQHEYALLKERDLSFGKRSRMSVDVVASDTAPTQEARILPAMKAAVDAHRRKWPHVVSARVWLSSDQDIMIARAVYALDGCGWSGDPCKQNIWTDMQASAHDPPYTEHEGTKFPRGLSAVKLSDDLHSWGRPTEAEKEKGKELACPQDLQCWANKHIIDASVACERLIENRAPFDYKWTDGWLERKLTGFAWKKRKAGLISYYGDKVKFQNRFGAWVHMGYKCDYNPATKTASVTVFPRR